MSRRATRDGVVELSVRNGSTRDAAQKFEGLVQLRGDGLASFDAVEVTFVVPPPDEAGSCVPDAGPVH